MTTTVGIHHRHWDFIPHGLWHREIDTYPTTVRRVGYLSVVVMATIVLYYQLYVAGAVAPQILAHYGMTFRFYVNITVVSSVFGAFASLVAGLGDRFGRANMVVYGLLISGALVLFGIPHASTSWQFAMISVAIGFVEGIILVATPALVRDFSPQLGRASAMGFWTLGPVVGSLIVSVVATNTLTHLVAWQDQFIICGVVSLVVFAIAFLQLHELSPALRDQVMVSKRDRALVEARAKGVDVEAALKHPWRQMLHWDIVLSAFAIAVFLLIYYTAVGFNVIYFESVFKFSATQANSLGNWFWAFDAGVLIAVGVLSDWARVRKPFMVVGSLGAIAMTAIYLSRTTQPTSYHTFVLILVLLAVSLAVAYSPWMASFTETVERRNPALVATGLSIWGWIIRAVVAISVFCLPFVVSSTTTLVDHSAVAAEATAIVKSDPLVPIVLAHPVLFAQLESYPPNHIPPALVNEAVREVGLSNLLAIGSDTHMKSELAFFTANAATLATVTKAAASAPRQWRDWYWVCLGGEVLFLGLVPILSGRWSPRRAREDAAAHERDVQAALAGMGQPTAA